MQDKKNLLEEFMFTVNFSLKNASHNFIMIGYCLIRCQDEKFYEVENYTDFLEFVHDKFHFSKTTTYRFIALCEAYCKRDENNNVTQTLDERYKEYSSSQLSEMLGLNYEDRQQINPDMTVKEIRNFKKKKKKLKSDNVGSVDFTGINKVKSTAPAGVCLVPNSDPDLSVPVPVSANYEHLNYVDTNEFNNCESLVYKETIRVVKDAAAYTAAFPKVLKYLNEGNYAVRICLYELKEK